MLVKLRTHNNKGGRRAVIHVPDSLHAEVVGRADSGIPRTELKPRLVQHVRPLGANWLAVGIALVTMTSLSSPMCRTTRAWPAAIAMAVAAGGAMKASKTTVLMTGTEGVGAMKKTADVTKTYKPAR